MPPGFTHVAGLVAFAGGLAATGAGVERAAQAAKERATNDVMRFMVGPRCSIDFFVGDGMARSEAIPGRFVPDAGRLGANLE